MSDIIVRHGKEKMVPPVAREFEPLRWVRELMRFDPFQEISPIWQGEERFIPYMPAFEVFETKDAFVLKADLPGVKEIDLNVTLTNNRLTIAGKRDSEVQDNPPEKLYVYERTYGNFTRVFTLPEGVDVEHIRAELKFGVLTCVLPKLPEMLPKKIVVTGVEKPRS